MHLYAQGGYAFGLRSTKSPVTRWHELVETWLGTNRAVLSVNSGGTPELKFLDGNGKIPSKFPDYTHHGVNEL